MKSKTIILSSQNEQKSGRGILTLKIEDDLLQCKLRLYNLSPLNKFCKIGIYHNNEVFSANLLEKNGVYSSSLVGTFDIENDFFTAIVDTQKNNDIIISGGTYAGCFVDDNSMFNHIEKENPETPLFDYSTYESPIHANINENVENERFENEIIDTKNLENCQTNEHDCDKCLHCKYKEYFYSHTEHEIEDSTQSETLNQEVENFEQIENEKQTRTFSINETKNLETSAEKTSIITSLISQFQYVFENYQKDEILSQLIENSKFVKINENKETYSIGAIYDDTEMKYICYAVPCDYNTPAPTELGEHYQWLPLDKEDPLSDGYYIVFQDAKDLKIVGF